MKKERSQESEVRSQNRNLKAVNHKGTKTQSRPGDERFWTIFLRIFLHPNAWDISQSMQVASKALLKKHPRAVIPTYEQVRYQVKKLDPHAVHLARYGEKAIKKCLSGYILPYNHATQKTKAISAVVNQHVITLNPEVNFLQECRIKCILAEINGIIHAAGKPTEQILILYKPEYLSAGDQDRIEYKVAEINAIIKDKKIK